jgi:hypothetical protein
VIYLLDGILILSFFCSVVQEVQEPGKKPKSSRSRKALSEENEVVVEAVRGLPRLFLHAVGCVLRHSELDKTTYAQDKIGC